MCSRSSIVWSSGTVTQDLEPIRADWGDANCDGNVTIADSLVILQFVVGNRSSVSSCPLGDTAGEIHDHVGDVNSDGAANISDALMIMQCIVGNTNPYCDAP